MDFVYYEKAESTRKSSKRFKQLEFVSEK